MGFAAFSMGARYFTGRASTSPYLGGGFAWSYETVIDQLSAFFKGSHSGLGAYVEAGVAFFHTHRADIEIGARVNLPFYSLTPDSIVETVTTRPDGTQMVNESLPAPIYYVPLSLELRVRFERNADEARGASSPSSYFVGGGWEHRSLMQRSAESQQSALVEHLSSSFEHGGGFAVHCRPPLT